MEGLQLRGLGGSRLGCLGADVLQALGAVAVDEAGVQGVPGLQHPAVVIGLERNGLVQGHLRPRSHEVSPREAVGHRVVPVGADGDRAAPEHGDLNHGDGHRGELVRDVDRAGSHLGNFEPGEQVIGLGAAPVLELGVHHGLDEDGALVVALEIDDAVLSNGQAPGQRVEVYECFGQSGLEESDHVHERIVFIDYFFVEMNDAAEGGVDDAIQIAQLQPMLLRGRLGAHDCFR
ncbi:hypothetical protein Mapa_004620 [Marchantia paleacea]|nr:hypothetical protein Mapa_004620 [Marchantia paleacea]